MSGLAIRWERNLAPVGPVDRPKAHRLGTLRIAGVPHHVEAFEVEDRGGCQESRRPERETSFAELSDTAEGPMRTVTIASRPDVLLVTPFQE